MRARTFFLAAAVGLTSGSSSLAGDVSVSFTPQSLGPIAEPVITSIKIDGTNLLVLASVPAGYSSVTLEGCRRLNAQAWTPRAVGRVQGASGQVTFRLPRVAGLEMLRLRADATALLPDSFFLGPSSFAGQPISSSSTPPGLADSGTVTFTGTGIAPGPTFSGTQPGTRTVEESDIWKLN